MSSEHCQPPSVWIRYLAGFSDILPEWIYHGLVRMVKRVRVKWNVTTFTLMIFLLVSYYAPSSYASLQEKTRHSFSDQELHTLQSEIQTDREELCASSLTELDTERCIRFFDAASHMIHDPNLVQGLSHSLSENKIPEYVQERLLAGLEANSIEMRRTFRDMVERDELKVLARLSLMNTGLYHPLQDMMVHERGVPELLLYSLVDRNPDLTTVSFVVPNVLHHPRIISSDRSYGVEAHQYFRYYHPLDTTHIQEDPSFYVQNYRHFSAELQEVILPALFRQRQRFMIITFGVDMGESRHANGLLFDTHLRRVIVIDPHGGSARTFVNWQGKTVGYFDDLVRMIRGSITNVQETVPNAQMYEVVFADEKALGLQALEGLVERQPGKVKRNRNTQPQGFCTVFVLMSTELLVKYSDHTLENVFHTWLWLTQKLHDQDTFILAQNYASILSRNLYEVLYTNQEVLEKHAYVSKVRMYTNPYSVEARALVSEETREAISGYRWWMGREQGKDHVGAMEHVYLGRVVKRCLKELIRGEIEWHQKYGKLVCFVWNQYLYRNIVPETNEPVTTHSVETFWEEIVTPSVGEMIRSYEELGRLNQTVRENLYVMGDLDEKEQEAADWLAMLQRPEGQSELIKLSEETTRFLQDLTLIRYRPTRENPYPIRTQFQQQIRRIWRYLQKKGRKASGGNVVVYGKEIEIQRYISVMQELGGYLR